MYFSVKYGIEHFSFIKFSNKTFPVFRKLFGCVAACDFVLFDDNMHNIFIICIYNMDIMDTQPYLNILE